LTPAKTKEPLHVFHEDGSPYKYSPSSLVVAVEPNGGLRVSFRPYIYLVDDEFRRRMHATVAGCWDLLGSVMEMARICPVSAKPWTPLRDSLLNSCHWESPLLHFPLSESRWLG